MKTFYVIQNNSLEEYLEDNSSNYESYGNGNEGCKPHSACWCANHPNGHKHPKCSGTVAPIDANIGFFLLIGAVIGIMFLVKKKIL